MSAAKNFKYLLAQMAFEEPARFLLTFAGEDGREYLRALWNRMQLRALGEDAFEPTDAVDVQVHDRVLMLVLPPPTEQGGAIALAVTGGQAGLRVFSLELGDPQGEDRAFVVELSPQGPSNHGPWADRELASFAARVDELTHPRN